MNIVDILAEHAVNRPEHPAIEDGARIVTYGELDWAVNAAAANLRAAGIAPGDIVAVLLDDSAEHVIVLCALAHIGAVIFSSNANTARAELKRSLANVAVKAVITRGSGGISDSCVWLRAADVCRPAAAAFAGPGAANDDALMLIQSSGTTGTPKSFLRSHAELAIWIDRYRRSHGWSADERCLSLTRMSFNVGRNITIGMLQLGATVVINHARSHAELASLVCDRRISYLKLTPSHLVPLLEFAADKAPLFPGLRAMVVGSAPSTHVQRLLARERLTPNLFEQLGCNEAGLLTLALPADQDAYPHAVGRIVDGVAAQIVDDADQPLPAGAIGHVRFRGAGYPTRYLDDPEATARAFRDGWFYPGDIAALNDEGYLFLKGRADDVINNGGAKFYPVEVEAALLAHPRVREAAVFGWPHARFGQVAAACVVAVQPLPILDLHKFCAQHIAAYKVPTIIEFLPELPKNAMGKVVKGKLKPIVARAVAAQQS